MYQRILKRSERYCNTEDWSNGSFAIIGINYNILKEKNIIVIIFYNITVSSCISNQSNINTALVSISDFFQKE